MKNMSRFVLSVSRSLSIITASSYSSSLCPTLIRRINSTNRIKKSSLNYLSIRFSNSTGSDSFICSYITIGIFISCMRALTFKSVQVFTQNFAH